MSDRHRYLIRTPQGRPGAQAGRPDWAPPGVDLGVPSTARMYDYYLGGSHHVEADREAARRAIAAWPGLPRIMRSNREFMRRAVRFAVGEGIRQFLDIGSGIPTEGNLHEVAQALDPAARVVYVDHDPVAVAHARTVLRDDPRAAVVAADLRSPGDVLGAADVRRLIDLDEPVALSLVAVLHFVEDGDDPWSTLRELGDALAPGSLLILLHSSTDDGPERDGGAGVRDVYRRAGSPLVQRTRAEITRFFDGFDLVEPGLVAPHLWRPDGEPDSDPVLHSGFAGVGRRGPALDPSDI